MCRWTLTCPKSAPGMVTWMFWLLWLSRRGVIHILKMCSLLLSLSRCVCVCVERFRCCDLSGRPCCTSLWCSQWCACVRSISCMCSIFWTSCRSHPRSACNFKQSKQKYVENVFKPSSPPPESWEYLGFDQHSGTVVCGSRPGERVEPEPIHI